MHTAFKFIVFDVLLDFLYLPVWWYSKGLLQILSWIGGCIRYVNGLTGLGLWTKSLFKPMYGERSFQGRIVSFVMRIVVLVWKLLSFGICLIVLLLLLVGWLIFLPAVVWQIIGVVRI